MISWKKLELFDECLNQLDYDNGGGVHGRNLVRPHLKGRRKKVIEALTMSEMPTINEMSEIFGVSKSNIRPLEDRALRALSNVLKLRGLTIDDFVETV